MSFVLEWRRGSFSLHAPNVLDKDVMSLSDRATTFQAKLQAQTPSVERLAMHMLVKQAKTIVTPAMIRQSYMCGSLPMKSDHYR